METALYTALGFVLGYFAIMVIEYLRHLPETLARNRAEREFDRFLATAAKSLHDHLNSAEHAAHVAKHQAEMKKAATKRKATTRQKPTSTPKKSAAKKSATRKAAK